MVPVDEASQVISDPKSRKKAQPVTEQLSSGPTPSGSRFNPIHMEPGSVSINSTRDLQVLFPNSFDCIGDMQGKYNIKKDPTIPPVQHRRQKVPIEYKEEIEKELAEMVWQKIIIKQTEPTPWVSSLMYPKKANGKLRICLDPKDLNKAIICENHKAPLSFLGAVNYLQTFIPHLSLNTEPLLALLKKENCFAWDENTNTCQKIKSQLQKALRPLRYYDWSKPVTLQCDASLKGLGACIIQDRQPIAFVSKSLTDTEIHYTNIERELLAIIYGCEKFHTYLYRRTFIVKTDHKPLKMISLKYLTAAPAHLQRMLLHLQQYDLVIMYQSGREMLLVDALSHFPSRTNTEIKLDL